MAGGHLTDTRRPLQTDSAFPAKMAAGLSGWMGGIGQSCSIKIFEPQMDADEHR
jgi:hypothetical protein